VLVNRAKTALPDLFFNKAICSSVDTGYKDKAFVFGLHQEGAWPRVSDHPHPHLGKLNETKAWHYGRAAVRSPIQVGAAGRNVFTEDGAAD
jgi:hypothetical protein